MARASRPVLLVGGIAGADAASVMTTVGPLLGDIALGLTDGETGARRLWALYLAYELWGKHPDVETVKAVVGVDPAQIPDGVVPDDWKDKVPQGYHDLPWFSLKYGVEKLETAGVTTTYPEHAAEGYRVFCELRENGTLPEGLRYQVCIPFPDDAVRIFTNDSPSMNALIAAYIEIVRNDMATLCSIIPHDELAIQWDVNWETIALEHGDYIPDTPPMQFRPDSDPWDRYLAFVRELNASVPEDVPLGLHLCYGDLHHKHFRDPADLRTSVAMANRATEASPRPISYFHFTVPRHRSDDEYFAPLADLSIGDATVYAGLVHYTDGADGSIKRLETLKRHYQGSLGVSTECGLGRRPPNQDLIALLKIHQDVAAAI